MLKINYLHLSLVVQGHCNGECSYPLRPKGSNKDPRCAEVLEDGAEDECCVKLNCAVPRLG